MIASTSRRGSRTAKAVLSGLALLLVATGCSNTSAVGDPTISVKESRNSAGVLQALTVKGQSVTPSGTVRITVLMAAGATNASPYSEEDIKADANGKFTYDKRPLPCPATADYGSGSWVNVVARDMTSGISGSRLLRPGATPDCKA